jgi:hypothetical protein
LSVKEIYVIIKLLSFLMSAQNYAIILFFFFFFFFFFLWGFYNLERYIFDDDIGHNDRDDNDDDGDDEGCGLDLTPMLVVVEVWLAWVNL